jgi:hypothetical protein
MFAELPDGDPALVDSVDEFRIKTLDQLSKVKTFRKTWPYLRNEIFRRLGENPSGDDIFRLGDQLSEVFQSVPKAVKAEAAEAGDLDETLGGRTQSDVSTGGVVWECLVTWYLNLVCYGTSVIAVKRTRKNTPLVVSDALAVTLQGYSTTTEADVVLYTVPSGPKEVLTLSKINNRIFERTQECSVAVVQCKTNWNDNAQIPMLWDLIYRSLPFVQVSAIHLGRRGMSPRCFKGDSIKYAFMTVPSNKRVYKPGTVPVTRVQGLSGGNYWGKPSETGVAAGFSEFLGRNFGAHFVGSVQNHVSGHLLANPASWGMFLDLDFA